MTFECCQNLTSFVVFAFADEETRAVGQKRTQSPDAESEEYLEGQGESPGDVAWSEGEAKGEPVCYQHTSSDIYGSGNSPVADAESGDTVRHLDNDEFATALHLARLTLPDLCDTFCQLRRFRSMT